MHLVGSFPLSLPHLRDRARGRQGMTFELFFVIQMFNGCRI